MDKKQHKALKTINKATGFPSRHGKGYVQYQKNGCPPGLMFDFKTDKCKVNTAVFLEAAIRGHDIKVLDKFGMVVDIPHKEALIIAPWLLKLHDEQINEINYLINVSDVPKMYHMLEERLGKGFYKRM
jgi:hypothetical protein